MVDYPKAFVLPVSSANRTRPRSVHVFNDSEHILPTSDFHWTTFSPAVATFISSAQFNNNLYTEIHSSPTFWEPIYLSSLAGSSTCLGASVAFLVPMIHKWRNDGKKQSINEADKALRSDRYDDVNSEFVGPDLLSFSLALAGSVMITVCLVSIIPECLDIEERKAAVVVESFDDIFLRRFMGFGIGVGVYALLSQLLNKLPEEYEWGDLLGDAFDLTNDNRTQMETLPQTEAYKGKEAIFYQQMNCTPTCVIQSHHNHLSIPPLPSQSIDESTKSLSSTKSDIGKHPIHNHPDLSMSNPQRKQSPWRLTLLLFLSLLLHNFPEGVAVSLSAASANGIQTKGATSTILSRGTEAYENTFEGANPKSISSVKEMAETIDKTINSDSFTSDMALSIINQNNLDSSTLKSSRPPSSLASIVTLSIALHNIPEGIAICIPCLKSRPDKPWLAFGLASLSGLAEPIGAFVALVVLKLREEADASLILLNDGSVYEDMGNALAFVAGIMMAVAVFELLPEADRQRKECDNSISFVWGVVIGVGVMVITEFYLG